MIVVTVVARTVLDSVVSWSARVVVATADFRGGASCFEKTIATDIGRRNEPEG